MHLLGSFLYNVLPATLAFAFSGIYVIVDGWFVGQSAGDAGLAAINIAYPMVALVNAAATGIGMAGGIHISVSIGKGDEAAQRRYTGCTLLLLLGTGLALMALLALVYRPALVVFGATGASYDAAVGYMGVMLLGSVFQMLGSGVVPLLRNFGGAVAAMAAMVTGFMMNVFLDWLFVFHYGLGVTGAAAATVASQGAVMLLSLGFMAARGKLIRFPDYRPHRATIAKILLVAVSPFGITISPYISMAILNKGAAIYGGEQALANYATVAYVTCIVQHLIQGISDGTQPLLSRSYGRHELDKVRGYRTLGYAFSIGLAVVCTAISVRLGYPLAEFFGVSEAVARDVEATLPVFAAGFVFLAFIRMTTSSFYATQCDRSAYILIYSEVVCMAVFVFLILAPLFGVLGVWMSVPATQAAMSLLGAVLLVRQRRETA